MHHPCVCLGSAAKTSLLSRSPVLGHPLPSQVILGSSSATQAGQALAMPPPTSGCRAMLLGAWGALLLVIVCLFSALPPFCILQLPGVATRGQRPSLLLVPCSWLPCAKCPQAAPVPLADSWVGEIQQCQALLKENSLCLIPVPDPCSSSWCCMLLPASSQGRNIPCFTSQPWHTPATGLCL